MLDKLDGYKKRKGLEGPMRLADGQIYYYDKNEGAYYDPRIDIYVDPEWQAKIDQMLLDKLMK